MLNTSQVTVLSFSAVLVVLFLVLLMVDIKMATSNHENRVEIISTQYISSADLVKQGARAPYSDAYVVRFFLENKQESSHVSPDSFRKINKMRMENGSMNFLVQYKKSFFTRKIMDIDVVLNSNSQFNSIE